LTYQITSDSTCDLSRELVERENIRVIPLYVQMGGKTYRDGIDVHPDDIYAHVSAGGSLAATAAVNLADYVQLFSELSRRVDFVIHICISSDFSSCYQNACLAAADYPNVYVIDSRNLSTGHGHVVLEAARLAKEGLAPEEIVACLNELTSRVDASFILDQLVYLKKGGRCSSVALLGANLLRLRPCIDVRDGKMGLGKKYRGSFEKCMVQYITDRIGNRDDLVLERIFITHSGLAPETVALAEKTVRSLQPFREVCITRAGCTVSSHCGPGTIGVLYIHKGKF
jgi:DegV family protein with EDD domain